LLGPFLEAALTEALKHQGPTTSTPMQGL